MEFSDLVSLMASGTLETLYMVIVSAVLAYVFGLPIGILLYVTDKQNISENKYVNAVVGVLVNILRSVPFIILLVLILPLTRIIVGTTIGTTASIVPLVISAAPFVGRMIESSLKEVDAGVIEAAESMGASPFQIIWKVLIPEALPSIIVGATITVTTILGYSAMAGFVGGGGLGTIAINYGYYRYNQEVMIITVVLLIILVQLFQVIGMYIAKKIDKRINE